MKIPCLDSHGNRLEFDESDYIYRESAYGIAVRDGSVLMVQDTISYTWEFPGGGLEQGETPVEGMKREIIEETGMIIGSKAELITSVTEYYKDIYSKNPWKSHRSYFRVDLIGGHLLHSGNGEDTTQAAFIPLDQLTSYPMRGSVQQVITLLRKR